MAKIGCLRILPVGLLPVSIFGPAMNPPVLAADILCVAHTGPASMQAVRRRREQPFEPAAIGPVGPESPAGPTGGR